jgi:hypothetical protein
VDLETAEEAWVQPALDRDQILARPRELHRRLGRQPTMNTEDKPTGKNIFFYTPRPGQASPGFNTMDRDVRS